MFEKTPASILTRGEGVAGERNEIRVTVATLTSQTKKLTRYTLPDEQWTVGMGKR